MKGSPSRQGRIIRLVRAAKQSKIEKKLSSNDLLADVKSQAWNDPHYSILFDCLLIKPKKNIFSSNELCLIFQLKRHLILDLIANFILHTIPCSFSPPALLQTGSLLSFSIPTGVKKLPSTRNKLKSEIAESFELSARRRANFFGVESGWLKRTAKLDGSCFNWEARLHPIISFWYSMRKMKFVDYFLFYFFYSLHSNYLPIIQCAPDWLMRLNQTKSDQTIQNQIKQYQIRSNHSKPSHSKPD